MIKTLAVFYLLGATCFCSASPTGGLPNHRQPQSQSKNFQAQRALWQSQQIGNLQANVPQSRLQESENEINEIDSTGAAVAALAMTAVEDKQVPTQPPPPLQPQTTTSAPQPIPPSNKPFNSQQFHQLPYHPPGIPVTQYSGIPVTQYSGIPITQYSGMPVTQYSGKPVTEYSGKPVTEYSGKPVSEYSGKPVTEYSGIPVTQYSGMQIAGYQNAQTGQTPISQHQQLFYAGGSNSVPMMIYSDSATPPITMFYLGQGDKQNQISVPNLQPVNPQMYSQGFTSYNMPMNFPDSIATYPLNSWDRQFPVYETFSSSQPQYYPFNNVISKTKENQRGKRIFTQMSLKPKTVDMDFETELSSSPPESPFISTSNVFNQRAVPPIWMLPKKPSTIGNMRSVVTPLWGRAISSSWNNPMMRSSLNDFEVPMLRSKHTSAPISSYTPTGSGSSYDSNGGQTYSREQSLGNHPSGSGSLYTTGGRRSSPRVSGYTSGVPTSSTYSTNGGQHSAMNQGDHSQAQTGSGSQSLYDHNKKGTSFVQPLPNGGHVSSFSTSQSGYSGTSQGQGSLSNSNKNYHNQHMGGQESSSYLTPGSSHYKSGGLAGYSGISGSGLLGAVNPQSSLHENTQAPHEFGTNIQQSDKAAPIIAIVPVEVVIPSDQEQPIAVSKDQHYPRLIPTSLGNHPSQSSQAPVFSQTSDPKNAMLGLQYGLGGIGGAGYGNTGLNNQYSNLHNGQIAAQSSGANSNQQYGHENVNTGFVQPLPMGGSVFSNVHSDEGFSGNNYGQGSNSVGVLDHNMNAGGLNSNRGYSGVNGLGIGGLGTGILPGAGLGTGILPGAGYGGGIGLNGGLGVGGIGMTGGLLG